MIIADNLFAYLTHSDIANFLTILIFRLIFIVFIVLFLHVGDHDRDTYVTYAYHQ